MTGTERRIDPRNYLDLAGGREDIAAALRQQDEEITAFVHAEERKRLIEGIVPALGALSTEQLKVISTTVVNMGNVNVGGQQNG